MQNCFRATFDMTMPQAENEWQQLQIDSVSWTGPTAILVSGITREGEVRVKCFHV